MTRAFTRWTLIAVLVIGGILLYSTWRMDHPGTIATPAAAATSGATVSGSQTCAYQTRDGDYTVTVAEENVAGCGPVVQALATFGAYWQPDTSTAADGLPLPDADRYCGFTSSTGSGTLLYVYETAGNDEPVGSGLAGTICTAQEQNGWVPMQDGAGG